MATSTYQLRRFEQLILKDQSAGDPVQVPASATIALYRQGATVSAPVTVGSSPTTVLVYETGSIQVGDVVQVGTGSDSLAIDSVVSTGSVTAHKVGAGTVAVSVGTRLINTSRPATIYSDPLGTVAVGTTIATDPSTGRASGYIREPRFDYIVSGSGLSARLYADAAGGFQLGGTAWVNALDYDSIQAAVDALPPDGGVVYIPASRPGEPAQPYNTTTKPSYTPPLYLPANRAVHLVGDGPFATYLQSTNPNEDMVVMGGDYQVIEELTLLGPNQPPSPGVIGGRGIRIWRTANYSIPYEGIPANSIVWGARIRNVRIQRTASWGIFVDNTPRPPEAPFGEWIVWGMVDNVEIREPRRDGCLLVTTPTTTLHFTNCTFKQFVGRGAEIHGDGIVLRNCQFDSSSSGATEFVYTDAQFGPRIELCQFASNAVATNYFIEVAGSMLGLYIVNCQFSRGMGGLVKGIHVGGHARAVIIVQPSFYVADPPSANDQVVLDEAVAPGTRVEATVIGGSLTHSGSTGSPMRILDAARATQLINASRRMRIPRATAVEILGDPSATPPIAGFDPLYLKEGDMVFDTTNQRVLVFHDLVTGWREALLGPPI